MSTLPRLTLLLLFWSAFCRSNYVEQKLEKTAVVAAFTRVAICNDYSNAVFYMSKNPEPQTKWVIFIEGGGICSSEKECDERWLAKKYYMSSKFYPKYIIGKDVLSNSPDDNEFHSYNKVLLPYCSSDSWLGSSKLVPSSHWSTTGYDARYKFTFQGHRILTNVIMDLLTFHGLRHATEVVLAGSSAGGTGLLNHLTDLRKFIPPTARLTALIDSSWFINFKDMLIRNNRQQFLDLTGMNTRPACRDITHGFPCCLSAHCLLRENYVTNQVPIFFVTSKYDIYMLSKGLLGGKSNNVVKPKDLMINVHSYGAQMQQQFDALSRSRNLAFLVTSCFQHTYLVSSSLWKMLYNDTVEFQDDLMHFKHQVIASQWDTVQIDHKSLSTIFHEWYNGTLSFPVNASHKTVQWKDSCLHAQCNPTCPSTVKFTASDTVWPLWARIIIMIFPLLVTIITLIVKVLFLYETKRLKRTQDSYVKTISKEEVLAGLEGVPTVDSNNYVGLACLNLQFKTNKDKIGRVNNMKRKMSLANIRRNRKQSTFFNPNLGILNGISSYFNPGQLVAIMGPSGSGKTTFLDMLTGRRSDDDQVQEQVYINGFPMKDVKKWFVRNTGYVLQLATPYLKELTVRQNLTYCAMMRLPKSVPLTEKLWRVEQVLGQTGLLEIADVVVGDAVGPGLSGGQKRRLCVAIQLLALPSVLFLDEPTSGLDSTSSLELLQTLHSLTLSGRLVIVTIHQPRIEIFHMFDRILFLCKGQVTFYGSPIMAPKMIAEALEHCGQKVDAENPADTIMDALTNEKSQEAILRYYSRSGEMEAISRAIEKAIRNPARPFNMKSKQPHSGIIGRLLAMECRASCSQQIGQFLYFPVVFLLYGIALGTCYFQTNEGILLMSCYQVFACASQLFMASVIHGHLGRTLPIFALEKADGVGHSYELVFHTFVRITSQTLFPLLMCSAIIYLCTVVHMDLMKFVLSTIIHIQLNHVWTIIIMFFACTLPRFSPLICPLLSAISGFAGGFLVPKPQMPWFYSWMFSINPTHWAYSAMTKILLDDTVFNCEMQSPLECTRSFGVVILKQFGFENVNPYMSMVVLFCMFGFLFAMTIISVELNYLQNTKTRTLPTSQEMYNSLRRSFRAFWLRVRKRGNYRSDADIERLLKENEERLLSHQAKSGPRGKGDAPSEPPKVERPHRRQPGATTLEPPQSTSSINTNGSESPADNSHQARQSRHLQRSQTHHPNTKHIAPVLKSIARSRTFNSTEKANGNVASESESNQQLATSSPKWRTERRSRAARRGLSMRATKKLYRNTRSSQYVVDKETLSKYLDVVPRSHEVFCSLSVVSKKPDKEKEKEKEKSVVLRRRAVERSDSIHVQKRASMYILAEKRKTMNAQMNNFDLVDSPVSNPRRSFGEIRRIRFPYVIPLDQVEADRKEAESRRPKSRTNSSASRKSDRAPPRYAFLADGNITTDDDDEDDEDEVANEGANSDTGEDNVFKLGVVDDPLVQEKINSYRELREGLLISLAEANGKASKDGLFRHSYTDSEAKSGIETDPEYDNMSNGNVKMVTSEEDVRQKAFDDDSDRPPSYKDRIAVDSPDIQSKRQVLGSDYDDANDDVDATENGENSTEQEQMALFDFDIEQVNEVREYDEMSETDL